MPVSGSRKKDLVVLFTISDKSDEVNPYITMLMQSMPPSVRTLDFNWPRALFGRYDVIHLHWPEFLIRGDSFRERQLKRLVFMLLCARLRFSRIRVVQTIHNVKPHESGSRVERAMLHALSSQTKRWIKLNPLPVERPSGQIVEILLGHYRDWFAPYENAASIPGRFLFFGLIRPYKQVDSLIAAFGELDDPATDLRIVGGCNDTELRALIAAAPATRANISVDLTYVRDEQLVRELGLSEMVVLPYRDLYNSAAVLAALSLNRPVLIPDSPAAIALQVEFGPEWVFLYHGRLTGETLEVSLARSRALHRAGTEPDLSKRDWAAISDAHHKVYAF